MLTVPAARVLSSWTASADEAPDLGPAALAVLLAETGDAAAHSVVRAALPKWLSGAVRPSARVGLHGGMAGTLLGVQLIARLHPPAARLAGRVSAWIEDHLDRHPWRTSQLRYPDYDVISGSAGLALAGVKRGEDHLDRLGSLRVGGHEGDPLSGWIQGGIDTGMAHGAAGVLTARPNRELADWLAAESYRDGLGVLSWARRAREGAPPPPHAVNRQAWCYGTPGIAWALWVGGAREQATEAMLSLCAAWDPEVHLTGSTGDRLGLCHGAAGVLLVADAFARHADLGEAASLRDRVERYLLDRLDTVRELAATDLGLLTGACGVLCALLTVRGGHRGWLSCLGLTPPEG
ncbi:hypothetical protein GCM10010174_84210 [Kutzneria viridogrisea]|uniref:Uncharacterized protein n=1 Tax=Kutzneria viridogrisea TaxID=47990 RepID=A0ABR6BFQ4_9PSEU|nr:hypothetical protein [Kutzneria viridogrisea]